MYALLVFLTLLVLAAVHGLAHRLAAGRPGRWLHALLPIYGCAGCGLFFRGSRRRRLLALAAGTPALYLGLVAVLVALYSCTGYPRDTMHLVVDGVEAD
ncbi:MAG TPA: hypothetical protein VL172_10135, partial [Kofleriaceae bacterium]|nr:hypothetical protein [Kofleriaceae bacterium]